jgi:hypothetical protein
MYNKPKIETNVVKPRVYFKENDKQYNFLETLDEATLDTQITQIENYIKTNDGRFQSEEYKDKLYGESKQMWEDYANFLRNVKFSFHINKKQFDYLTDLLIQDMEYDHDTIFFAIELTSMLGDWSKVENSEDDLELKSYQADAIEITYIYHLVAKHKVQGLTESSYRFAEVLRRLKEVHRVISYYDTVAKNLAKEIQDWVANFEPQPLPATSLAPQF